MQLQKIYQPAKNIKLLILDVDGILTDNKIYIANDGNELKAFNTRDGIGIKMLSRSGVQIAVISGRKSPATKMRLTELGIKHIYLNQDNKNSAYNELKKLLALTDTEIAYAGDDLPDLPLLKKVGLSISVADGYDLIKNQVMLVTKASGGQGAVREICELIMLAQNTLEAQQQYYLASDCG